MVALVIQLPYGKLLHGFTSKFLKAGFKMKSILLGRVTNLPKQPLRVFKTIGADQRPADFNEWVNAIYNRNKQK
jgi:hypothetical protein